MKDGWRLWLWRIGAVFAGLVVVVVTSTIADLAAEATGVLPRPENLDDYLTTHWLIASGYRALFTVLGGFVTASLAPDRPITHAFVLGFIGVCLGTLGAVIMWGVGPAWYPLSLIAEALPCTWLGAVLRPKRAVVG